MGYANGQIPADALVSVEGFLFDPSMAARLVPALAAARAAGGIVSINEGYRPLGVPNDQYIRTEGATSTGGSNQWFQWGRFLRDETPSAAYPGNSNHGWGKAGDADIQNRSVVVEAFRQYGLLFPISSEPWHFDDSGPILAGTTIATIFEEDHMAINDGGYIAEKKGDEFVRGAIFGPGVPGGVYVVDIRKGATLPPGVHSGKIEDLQAMGNLAGVRVFSPQDGSGKRVGAPIKYVGTAEFDATVKLAQSIYGRS